MKSPDGQTCPMHTDEFIKPLYVGSETAEYTFTCHRNGHPGAADFSWPFVPEPVNLAGDTLGLGLEIELPKAVATAAADCGKPWVEYGLIERAYALANPDDWAVLLDRYDHTHYHHGMDGTTALSYTASKYLARSLGALGRAGTLVHHSGPGTGRWNYNKTISYYALPPAGDWSSRQTWEGSGLDVESYMPVYDLEIWLGDDGVPRIQSVTNSNAPPTRPSTGLLERLTWQPGDITIIPPPQ